MTRQEHLLTIAAEECAEIAQRISKALRFGLDEVQDGQPHSNRERIEFETADLLAVLEMLGLLAPVTDSIMDHSWVRRSMDEKKRKVERWLSYSEQCGTLTDKSR